MLFYIVVWQALWSESSNHTGAAALTNHSPRLGGGGGGTGKGERGVRRLSMVSISFNP